VRAGINLGRFTESNFWYNSTTHKIYLANIEPEILDYDINPWPAAYFSINSWLNDYAYRITISPWYFVLGTALALLIAALTTGYQSLKAAQQNPIESLKYE
jgi:ABC-type transport system, involved in lipoprotein release, permease component